MDITKKNKKRKLTAEDGKKKKLGVCYLGRIPPRMDPSTIRQMLSQFGEIERVYLAPQDPSAQVHPPKPGKFQRQNFSEGWVEFSDKRVAKRVANMLNGEQIGGKKRSAFYYDLWNIKYLSKFKWDDLTEEIAYKKATREQKLALEISAAKRERDFYLAKVDKARALSAIDERLKKKLKIQEDAERDPDLSVSQPKKKKQKVQEDSERDLDLPVSQSKKKNQKVQQDSENEPELPVNLLEKKVIRRFRQKTPVADNTAASKPRVSLATLTDLWNSSN